MAISSTIVQMIESSLSVETFSFGRTRLEPHHCPPAFAVRGIVGINRYIGGRAAILLEGRPALTLTDGDAVILPEDIPIRTDNLSSGRTLSLWHNMRYSILSSLSPCDLLEMPTRIPRRHANRVGEINAALLRADGGSKAGFLMKTAKTHALAIELLMIILEVSRIRDDAEEILRRHNRLTPLLHYMATHIEQPQSTSLLASRVNLSEPRFFEVFLKSVGMPPGRYLQQLRLRKAQELLLATDMQVKEIAQKTGYQDEFHFSRLFKKRFGISPKSYRRQFSGLGGTE